MDLSKVRKGPEVTLSDLSKANFESAQKTGGNDPGDVESPAERDRDRLEEEGVEGATEERIEGATTH